MEKENGSKKWHFQVQENDLKNGSVPLTVREIQYSLLGNLNKEDERAVILLGNGDPSVFPCFRTSPAAADAIVESLKSANYNGKQQIGCNSVLGSISNGYAPNVGILPARRAVADYLNHDFPYKLSPDDVFLTTGCCQAIEVTLKVLSRPGANILLPRPGFPLYEAHIAQTHLRIRYFDLLPDKGWEVDLEAVEALADENTVAIVIINPGNPCGNVYSYQHLKQVAETARKLGILVIADEVYGHLAFGSSPFVPMGASGSIVPVLTLGSISKRWIVPGWRMGWLVLYDPNGILQDSGLVPSIKSCINIAGHPATFIQGAVPQIIENTKANFFSNVNNILREAADICYDRIQEIPCITCPVKPEGSMFVMVKLNLSVLNGIDDDMDFCLKLAKEESVIVIPGTAVGLKNWLRVTFASETAALEVGVGRIKAFCERHTKNKKQ